MRRHARLTKDDALATCQHQLPSRNSLNSLPTSFSPPPSLNCCEIYAAISSAPNSLRDIKETGNNCERATDKLKCFVGAAYLGSHGVCFIYTHLSRVCTRSAHKSLGLSRDSKIAHMLELCLARFALLSCSFNGAERTFISNYVGCGRRRGKMEGGGE